MADCLIGLGSNIGDRASQLDKAVDVFCGHPRIAFHSVSRYRDTRPIGGPAGQGAYLNAALRVTAQLAPIDLLAWALHIERQLGRRPAERWGPRPIDIDLLLYDCVTMCTPELTLPHSRMAVRRFVLEPALEIARDMLHAPTGWTVGQLWQRLHEIPHYIALVGGTHADRSALARAAADAAGARHLTDRSTVGLSSGTADGTDAACEMELARIACRVQQLQPLIGFVEQPTTKWFVSDFWINQSLAVARAFFDGPRRARIVHACQEAIEEIRVPTLVLLLDDPTWSVWESQRAPDNVLSSIGARYAHELQHLISRPGQGPILPVGGGSLQQAQTEL